MGNMEIMQVLRLTSTADKLFTDAAILQERQRLEGALTIKET